MTVPSYQFVKNCEWKSNPSWEKENMRYPLISLLSYTLHFPVQAMTESWAQLVDEFQPHSFIYLQPIFSEIAEQTRHILAL